MSWWLKILHQRAGGNPGTVGTQADSERFSFYSTFFRSYLSENISQAQHDMHMQMDPVSSGWSTSRNEWLVNKLKKQECLISPISLPVHLGSLDTNTICQLW